MASVRASVSSHETLSMNPEPSANMTHELVSQLKLKSENNLSFVDWDGPDDPENPKK